MYRTNTGLPIKCKIDETLSTEVESLYKEYLNLDEENLDAKIELIEKAIQVEKGKGNLFKLVLRDDCTLTSSGRSYISQLSDNLINGDRISENLTLWDELLKVDDESVFLPPNWTEEEIGRLTILSNPLHSNVAYKDFQGMSYIITSTHGGLGKYLKLLKIWLS